MQQARDCRPTGESMTAEAPGPNDPADKRARMQASDRAEGDPLPVPPAQMLARPYDRALAEAVDAAAPTMRKAEATRQRLLAATARLLAERGLARLKVTDISDAATTAHGTFYRYFDDKRAAAEAVLTAFARDCVSAIEASGGGPSAFGAIRHAIAAIATTYRLNPGLSRCLWQLDDSGTAFEHVLQDINARWHQRVADNLLRRTGRPDEARREATVMAYALAAMVDEFLIQFYLRRDSTLRALELSDEEIVDALSFLWHRAAFGRDPDGAAPGERARHGGLIGRLGAFR